MSNHYLILDDDGKPASKEWINSNPEKALQQSAQFKRLNDCYPLKEIECFDLLDLELNKRIVEEFATRKTILLIALGGKLVDNAEPTSSNLMVNDESGAGKDYITKSVMKLLPDEDVIIQKRISEKAFTYWHNANREPDWDWSGKVFYNEDITNNVLNSDVFKVFSSNDRNEVSKSTILINQNPVEIATKGKPVMIITIAMANPKQELLRRFPIANLDTTERQTKLILKRKAEFHKTGIKPSYDETIKTNLAKLKRCQVKVPYAPKLVEVLSTKNIIIRTHFDRFIDYIKFSAAIYQLQRKTDAEGFILAEKQDYDIARDALIKTTSNVFSVPLSKVQLKILDIFKELDKNLSYSVSELEAKVSFCSDRTLRKECDKLTEIGFLSKDREPRDGSTKDVMVYTYLGMYKIDIPTWENIQNISNASTASTASFNSSDSNGGANEALEANEQGAEGTETVEIEDIDDLGDLE